MATSTSHTARPSRRRGPADNAPERGRGKLGSLRRGSKPDTLSERLIAGVPARIMRPRLVFLVCVAAILGFGLLMVYSASSVEALKENGDSTYFLVRQAAFIAFGLVCAVCASRIPLRAWEGYAVWVPWIVIVVLLALTLVAGVNVNGATRWFVIAGQQIQPSEFAKPVIILAVAKVFKDYYEEYSIDTVRFLALLAAVVLVPVFLILAEPDLGSSIIIVSTVFLMCYFAGFSYKIIGGVLLALLAAGAALVIAEPYRMERLMSDPWEDLYGSGYQATRAIMAFASGGLFGRGIGNSTMKYLYLPEAHNDYILAVIGEELGFVGTALFFVVFAVMVYAGLKIAKQSPTLQGRLIAAACSVILMVQFIVNALGIIGVAPMTGKPMPLISYGGSSMIASLMLIGLIVRVSLESNVPGASKELRSRLAVVDESTAGEPHRRSERRGGFTVVDGGRPRGSRSAYAAEDETPPTSRDGSGYGGRATASPRSRPRAARQGSADTGSGWGRIDLGPSAADRLRNAGRAEDDRTSRPRGGGRGASRTTRRSRYDK